MDANLVAILIKLVLRISSQDKAWSLTVINVGDVSIHMVTGEKNSPTVTYTRRKRRLKWVLGAWGYNWATQSPGDINMETWSSRLGVGAQG